MANLLFGYCVSAAAVARSSTQYWAQLFNRYCLPVFLLDLLARSKLTCWPAERREQRARAFWIVDFDCHAQQPVGVSVFMGS